MGNWEYKVQVVRASCSLDIYSEQDARTTNSLSPHLPISLSPHLPIPILKSFTSKKQNFDINGIVIPEVSEIVKKADE